jgi:membrane-bound lytic murein transglycosylase D
MAPRRARSALVSLLALAALAAGCATVEPPPAPPRVLATPVELPPPPAPPVPGMAIPTPAATAEEPVYLPPGPPPPRGRLDPGQDAERASLWNRIRAGYAMHDLDGDRVQKWEQFYARQPDYVQRMVTRGGRYLFHIVEEIEKRQMPAELALLPFIESAFNPQAMSRARASGMWQFMPATGKDFELRQNVFRDDRRDVLASTRAALDYLQRLHGMFGDWHLALAAYNWGQGNVQRALDRNRRAGLPQDYTSLRMPDETRDYVPKLQAMKNIVGAPERLGLKLPELENHPYFVGVPIERDIDVALAARLAHLPLDDFQALNPQLDKPVILAAGTPQVLLPYDNANQFIRELPLVRGPLASWTAWVAPKNLKPAEAAKLVGMSESDLREVNRIPPRMVVKTGSTLLVPRAAHTTADVTEHLADHANLLLSPEGGPARKVSFKAGKNGDSVAAVAKRYRVSAEQVAQWNQVPANARFKAGQTITVMTTAPATSPARKLARAPARGGAKTVKPASRVRVAEVR